MSPQAFLLSVADDPGGSLDASIQHVAFRLVIASFAQHPIDSFLKQGDPVTVNTDGTLFTEVQLSDEYRKLQEAFGWTEADFLNVNLTALQCASFSEADKAVMKAALEAGYVH